jgi:hypothetical protein
MKKTPPIVNSVLIAITAIVLGACTGGPSDGEFVQACLKQSGQMVKMTEATCSCAARYARENFDPKQRQALLLDMQGRKQDAEALMEGTSIEDRGRFAMQQFEMVGRCLGGESGADR